MSANDLNMRDMIRTFIPPWMSDRVEKGFVAGFKYLYGHAQTFDLIIQMALEAAWARFPESAPDEALPHIGRDRKIWRYPNESHDSYVTRLIEWWDTAKKRGSAIQLLTDFKNYAAPSTPTVHVITQSGAWWTLKADGSIVRVVPSVGWNWDNAVEKWDRFWVVLYASEWGWVEDGSWGDGELWGHDPASTWGSTARLDEVQGIRAIVKDHLGADQVCPRIIVCFDDLMFNPDDDPSIDPLPDGTWGRWADEDGSGNYIPSRDPRAIYWRGPAT